MSPSPSLFKIFVRAILLNEEGSVLLIKKNHDQKMAPGRWLLPGGTTEFGEDIQATLCRELKEEINFDVTKASLAGTKTMLLEGCHWLGIYFYAHGDFTKIENLEPAKHARMEWFSIDHLPLDIDALERSWIRLTPLS